MQATNEFNEKMNEIKCSIERTLEDIKSYNEKIRQETNYLTFLMAWQKDLEDADKLKNESQSPATISKLNTRISSYELKLNMTENLVKFQSSLLTKTNKCGFKMIFWARSAIWWPDSGLHHFENLEQEMEELVTENRMLKGKELTIQENQLKNLQSQNEKLRIDNQNLNSISLVLIIFIFF